MKINDLSGLLYLKKYDLPKNKNTRNGFCSTRIMITAAAYVKPESCTSFEACFPGIYIAILYILHDNCLQFCKEKIRDLKSLKNSFVKNLLNFSRPENRVSHQLSK